MLEKLCDTHCHYDDSLFDADRHQVLCQQRASGVGVIITSGFHVPSSQAAVQLAHDYDFVWSSVGVFPLEAGSVQAPWLSDIQALAQDSRCVAIGEIGLDYFRPDGQLPSLDIRTQQQQVFAAQLALSTQLNLPAVIHDRDADEDVIAMLKTFKGKALIHRFFSQPKYGFALLDMGVSLGIGTAITYDNAQDLIEVVRAMPLSLLMLETDGPFLPSSDQANQRGTSDMLAQVCQVISQVRGDVSPQEVANISYANTCAFFNLPPSI